MNNYILIAIILIAASGTFISDFDISHIVGTPPGVGEWKNSEFKLKLSIFKDNTVIVDNGYRKKSCSWSRKDSNLIVIICSIGEYQDVSTFKAEASNKIG